MTTSFENRSYQHWPSWLESDGRGTILVVWMIEYAFVLIRLWDVPGFSGMISLMAGVRLNSSCSRDAGLAMAACSQESCSPSSTTEGTSPTPVTCKGFWCSEKVTSIPLDRVPRKKRASCKSSRLRSKGIEQQLTACLPLLLLESCFKQLQDLLSCFWPNLAHIIGCSCNQCVCIRPGYGDDMVYGLGPGYWSFYASEIA